MRAARQPLHGYTLIEVMVAAGILLVAIAAASGLALTMVSLEEDNTRVAQVLNLQEQAGRLYQLGLEPAAITGNLLAYETNTVTLTFTPGSTNVGGSTTVETAICEVIFSTGPAMNSASATPVSRTNTLLLVRPSLR